MSGHFAGDFTVAQLQQLAAVQPMPGRDGAHNRANHRVVTLPQMLAFHQAQLRSGSASGLYMELKHPAYHSAQVCASAAAPINRQ
jgi:glycerophosphoryl diester phosphodiesterase